MVHWLGCLFEACVLQVRVFDPPRPSPFCQLLCTCFCRCLTRLYLKTVRKGAVEHLGKCMKDDVPSELVGLKEEAWPGWRMAWRTSEQSYLVGPTLPGNALHGNSKFWSINLVPRSASCVCESWTQHWCRVWSAACWCFPPGSQGLLSIVTMVVSFEAAPFS